MSDLRYDIYFRGECLEHHNSAQVKQAFAKLFKLDSSKLPFYFSGKVLALKKAASKDEAVQFKKRLESIGAKIYIKQATIKKAYTQPELSALPVGSDVLKQEERKVGQKVNIDTSHLSLEDSMWQRLSESPELPPAPDVSHISTAEVGSKVLEGYTNEEIPLPEPDISHLALAEENGQLQESKKTHSAVAPDTSHLSLAD